MYHDIKTGSGHEQLMMVVIGWIKDSGGKKWEKEKAKRKKL